MAQAGAASHNSPRLVSQRGAGSGDPPAFLHPFALPAAGRSTYTTIVRGRGATVTDDEGRVYVDALASLWYCQVGHGRREINEAIVDQLGRVAGFHAFERFTNEPAEALTERLTELAPMPAGTARVFLTSGGSEAVDTALKLARIAHHVAGDERRTLVVSRRPSYHGVTYGAVSATGLPLNQAGFGPFVGDVELIDYDDLDALDKVIASRGDELAAVIAEPVVGAGGVLPPPAGYFKGLRDRCDATGAFLIVDEVICGFGRLGRWWGSQRYGVQADLVTFAKGVTSGYQPVGGVLVGSAVRDRIEADPDFLLRHGNTYAGHPVACAAAVANIGVIERDGLVDRAEHVGGRLSNGLRSLVDGDRIVELRGDGAMWAVRLSPDQVGRRPAPAVRDEMMNRGVIARPLGNDVIAFCPPLVIDDGEIDHCVEALSRALG